METMVIMKRSLFNCEISQNSKTEFFSATDLIRAGNKWRIANNLQHIDLNDWFNLKSTKEFISELEKKYGIVKISARGRGRHTWVHPYLFLDMALAISPSLKIEVYGWLYDYLLKYRNDSGDSFKRMSGSLYNNQTNKQLFPEYIKKVGFHIKNVCNVTDWQTATEEQLKLRDKIQDNISLLSDVLKNNDTAVRIGTHKAKQELNTS